MTGGLYGGFVVGGLYGGLVVGFIPGGYMAVGGGGLPGPGGYVGFVGRVGGQC